MELGDPAAAEKYFFKALGEDPNNYHANFAYFNCLTKLGKDKEAAEQSKRVEKINGDIKGLQEVLTRALPAEPNNPRWHYEAGVLFLRQGEVKEGLRMLYEALKLDRNYKPDQDELLTFYRRIGEFRTAAQLQEAIDSGDPLGPPVPLD
jgi:tetratricopeptide (TPR) repeat protein